MDESMKGAFASIEDWANWLEGSATVEDVVRLAKNNEHVVGILDDYGLTIDDVASAKICAEIQENYENAFGSLKRAKKLVSKIDAFLEKHE